MPDFLKVFCETGCFVELHSSVPWPWQNHKQVWTLEEAHACTAAIYFFFKSSDVNSDDTSLTSVTESQQF